MHVYNPIYNPIYIHLFPSIHTKSILSWNPVAELTGAAYRVAGGRWVAPWSWPAMEPWTSCWGSTSDWTTDAQFFRNLSVFLGDGIIGIIDFLEKKLEKSEAVVAFLVFLEPKNTCFVMASTSCCVADIWPVPGTSTPRKISWAVLRSWCPMVWPIKWCEMTRRACLQSSTGWALCPKISLAHLPCPNWLLTLGTATWNLSLLLIHTTHVTSCAVSLIMKAVDSGASLMPALGASTYAMIGKSCDFCYFSSPNHEM